MDSASSLWIANKSAAVRSYASAQTLRILRQINQLCCDAEAITGALNGNPENVSNAELPTDLAQIARHAAFILPHAGVADDLQIRDPGQIRQDLLLHTVSEYAFRSSSLKFSNGRTAIDFTGISVDRRVLRRRG